MHMRLKCALAKYFVGQLSSHTSLQWFYQQMQMLTMIKSVLPVPLTAHFKLIALEAGLACGRLSEADCMTI